MGVAIRIVDQVSGAPRRAARLLHLVSEQTTGRELIARRLQADAELDADAEPLVPPVEPGRSVMRWQIQHERACRAFERTAFLMLLDGRPIEDLDAALVVGPNSELLFLRLVPVLTRWRLARGGRSDRGAA